MDQIPDKILLQLFSRLCLEDRLNVSWVCRRWYELTQEPWTDIRTIDISTIPQRFLIPVLNHCPAIDSIRGANFRISIRCLEIASAIVSENLKSLKFHCAEINGLKAARCRPWELAYAEFWRSVFDNPNLEELVWHNVVMMPTNAAVPAPVCESLRCLQVTGQDTTSWCLRDIWPHDGLCKPEQLVQLEALLISGQSSLLNDERTPQSLTDNLRQMVQLRELAFDDAAPSLNLCLKQALLRCSGRLASLRVLVASCLSITTQELVTLFAGMALLETVVCSDFKIEFDAFGYPYWLEGRIQSAPMTRNSKPRHILYVREAPDDAKNYLHARIANLATISKVNLSSVSVANGILRGSYDDSPARKILEEYWTFQRVAETRQIMAKQ